MAQLPLHWFATNAIEQLVARKVHVGVLRSYHHLHGRLLAGRTFMRRAMNTDDNPIDHALLSLERFWTHVFSTTVGFLHMKLTVALQYLVGEPKRVQEDCVPIEPVRALSLTDSENVTEQRSPALSSGSQTTWPRMAAWT